MPRRALVLALGIVVGSMACSPTLPPTTVPAQPDPTFEPFRIALQAYVDLTQADRKLAAQEAEGAGQGRAGDRGGAVRSGAAESSGAFNGAGGK